MRKTQSKVATSSPSQKPTAVRSKRTVKVAPAEDVGGNAGAIKALKRTIVKKKKQSAKKVKRDNVVRDSFTMPKSDYKLIDTLKTKCLGLGMAVKKSEMLRAGLAVLAALPSDDLVQAVGGLARVKTGRPPSKKKAKKKSDSKGKKP